MPSNKVAKRPLPSMNYNKKHEQNHNANGNLHNLRPRRIKANNLLFYLMICLILGFLTLLGYVLTYDNESDEILSYILSSSSSSSSWLATSIYSNDESILDVLDETHEDELDEGMVFDMSSERIEDVEEDSSNGNQRNDEMELSSSYLTMYGDHRVGKSLQSLPMWFQEYVQWNRNVTSYPSNNNDHTTTTTNTSSSPKYLVLMCLPYDTCGGLSDRFRALAFNLFVAKKTSRVLCIYWTRPYPLETFLEPTLGGIDWRCPKQLSSLVDESKASKRQKKIKLHRWFRCHRTPIKECTEDGIRNIANNDDPYIATSFVNSITNINTLNHFVQRHSYKDYMPELSQWSYPEMIGDIFRVMFKPVKPLAERINATMRNLGLVEGQYSTVHVRARYPVTHLVHLMNDLKKDSDTFENMDKVDKGEVIFEGHTKHYLVETLENAVQCGHMLSPTLPMLFVSDHHDVTHYAISNDFLGKHDNQSFRPIGIDIDWIPPHLDVKHKNVSDAPVEYYGAFEDLLIIGGSKCVTYGVGSFGSFGAGLAGNRCRTVHRKAKGVDAPCPNDRGDRKPIHIYTNETLFGENPSGKLSF